jgi:signal transduction histidine kinase
LGGFLIMHPELCDVADLVRNVVGELEHAHANRRITVECRGNLMVSVDRKRVSQLLSNLVANALEHGVENTDVQVSASREGDAVIIEIRNAGPAIQPALMKRLFDPLSSGRKAQSNDGHLGLGLYIAQQIALAHGGGIDVHSSASTGTCVTVRLPGS